MHTTRWSPLVALLASLQMGCGLAGLYADIPPYAGDDADVGMDADAGDDSGFDGELIAPTNLVATGTPQGVELTWDTVPGATSYEVNVDGSWREVGTQSTYFDDTAPEGRLAGALSADASDATERAHVTLAASGDASGVPGDEVTYKVRALRAGSLSESSVEVRASRTVGEVSIRWEFSDDPEADFVALDGATSRAHSDTTALPNGDRRRYRVVASAVGASNELVSDEDEGWRLAAVEVAVSISHSCAVLSNGEVKCWGDNSKGKLGHGNRLDFGGAAPRSIPPSVNLGGEKAVRVFAGPNNTCATLEGGTSKCWGEADNQFAYLEQNNGDDPTDASPPNYVTLNPARSFHFGVENTCILDETGATHCIGEGSNAILGTMNVNQNLGDSEDDFPISSIETGTSFTKLSAAGEHACGITPSRRLRCWGSNYRQTLGISTKESVGNEPGDMPPRDLTLTDVIDVAAGGVGSTCILKADATIICWGDNSRGQSGIGSTTSKVIENWERDHPFDYRQHTNNADAIAIAAGSYSVCALLETSEVICWGASTANGTPNDIGDAPGFSLTPLDLGVGVAKLPHTSGNRHYCVVTTEGTVKCWGDNGSGQLGLHGDELDLSNPMQVVQLW